MLLYAIVINDVDYDQCEADASVYKDVYADKNEAFDKMRSICENDFQNAINNGLKDAYVKVDDQNMERTLYYDKSDDHYTKYCVQEIRA